MPTDHPRSLIRDYIAKGLVSAATLAGANVFADRIEPVGDNWSPAIFVHTPRENVDAKDSWVSSNPDSPGRLTRELTLAIAGLMDMPRSGVPIDRQLDQLAYQIEAFMDSDPTLGNLASKSLLQSSTVTLQPGGVDSVAMVQLVYNVTYYTETITVAMVPAVPVTEIFVGVAPDIGPDHVADYVEVVGP
jgi:hypothetical protein